MKYSTKLLLGFGILMFVSFAMGAFGVRFAFFVVLMLASSLVAHVSIKSIMKPVPEYSKTEKVQLEDTSEAMFASIDYARNIQVNLLPSKELFGSIFSDYSVIWKPRDVVGGDIYWLKRFPEGSVLCVCDCTGHGTPGALLTMLVVSSLENAVLAGNCRDTANIIWQVEKRLAEVFKVNERTDKSIKDGCDISIMYIANDGSLTMSAAYMNIFVCDGKTVKRHRGQKIFVGEGKLQNKDQIKSVYIEPNPNNKFYIASDGLFDQPDGIKDIPFGYKRFEKIILENHSKRQAAISEIIWDNFEDYRDLEARVDDFTLISFMP